MECSNGRSYIGRLPHGADLLEALEGICRSENITTGVFTVIGALSKVNLGCYDQKAQKYDPDMVFDQELEIASCNGNISLKDPEIFVHAHITVSDNTGKCYGGHLMPGSKIFAAEYHIQEIKGAVLERKPDKDTGLSLWQ